MKDLMSLWMLVYVKEMMMINFLGNSTASFHPHYLDQQPDTINVVVKREKTVELIPGKYFDATDDFLTHETLNSRSYIPNNEIVIQSCLQLNVL